jgi:nitrite reductase (cytochrome c-552)
MTTPQRSFWTRRTVIVLIVAFVVGAGIMAALAALLVSIQTHRDEAAQYPLKIVEVAATELDPVVWGRNFPREYDTFLQSKDDTIKTPYGGSFPFNKLERYPALVRLYAGYPFSVDYNKARGHYYALIDQKKTKRIQVVNQPATCANCHAAEAPQLIAAMGWENFSHTPYNDIKDKLNLGTSCADCHDPQTMNLRITRPAFVNAMQARGIDLSKATRQEMRTYVCAQCHVEYYFAGPNKVLTFPWTAGLTIDNIEAYYQKLDFKDWTHKESNAPMIKIQHPEFEMWSTSIHARSGVGCADCHMACIRDGAIKVSDHWLRSPLTNLNKACQTCHRQTEEELKIRVVQIQDCTAELLRRAETALTDALDSINAAQTSGVSDAELTPARQLYRRASMRWDFVFSENSTGFHSPQEAARILGDAIDFARQAQIEAERATPKK